MHVTALSVVVGALMAAGWGSAVTGNSFPMLSGAIWVPSDVGQVTLLSGGSTRPVAAVGVAAAGHVLSVAQSGPDAFVVDRTEGTVRRVAGSTFDASVPVKFADDGSRLQVLVNGAHVFVLDGAKGLAYRVNPISLKTEGSAVKLAEEVRPDSALVDSAGRLWVIDAGSGDLAWTDGVTHRREGAVPRGEGALLASGHSIVVVGGSGAQWLDSDGKTATRVDFGLRVGEHAVVSGTETGSLLVVVAERGVLEVCGSTECGAQAYPLVTSHSLGAAVAYDGRYLVPDYTKGAVYILDPDQAGAPVVGRLLDPAAVFSLTVRDTVLFYNDRGSNRAGILRLDGSHLGISKYDPKHPVANLDTGTKNAVPPVVMPPKIARPKPSPSPTKDTTPPKRTPSGTASNGPGRNGGNGPARPLFTISATVSPSPGVEGQPVRVAVQPADGVMSSCIWRIDSGSASVPCTQPITAPTAGAHTVLVDATSSTGSPASWQKPLSVMTAPASITSVAFSGPSGPGVGSPTITITGAEFGTTAPISYPNNATSCGQYTNNGSVFGEELYLANSNFSAGRGVPPNSTCVGIIVRSWTSTKIVLTFGAAYGSFDHWYLNDGDPYAIHVKSLQYANTVSGLTP